MTDVQGPRGVKRIRQACANCRRKKTRCPGERPICSFCLRLQQHCEYDDDGRNDASSSGLQYNTADVGLLAARIHELESKLNDISRTNSSSISDGANGFNYQEFSQDQLAQALSLDYVNGAQPHLSPTLQVLPRSFEFEPAIGVGDLPKATFDRLINDYFRYFHNQPYSFFHEPSFRQKIANGALPEFILEVVVMSALRFSTDPCFDDDLFFTNKRKSTADSFSRSAWKHISSQYIDEEAECSVSVVQGITLLAIFEFIEGRQRSAWVKIGIAAKFAQDLGLLFEPHSQLPFHDQEERRRAFWSIYLLDRLMTCGRGRPPVFVDTSITVQIPCSEDAFKESYWEQTAELSAYMTDQVLLTPQPSPFARVVIISALLSRCSQYAIQAQRDSKNLPPWDPKSEYTMINSCLLYLESHADWDQSVADSMTANTPDDQPRSNSTELLVISQALYHLCYCILNHYFLLRQKQSLSSTRSPNSFYINALQVGLHHAHEFASSIRSALDVSYMVFSSFLSYGCLVTATVHAVYRHSDFQPICDQAIQDLEFSLSFLERQAQYWPTSATTVTQLNDFCQHSQAYKDLINMSPYVNSIGQEDANRLYSLIDWSTLSNMRDVAVWPKLPKLENI